MEIVAEITAAQWLALAERVMQGLQALDCGDDPLVLSYGEVAQTLGYDPDTDFFMALWSYHQRYQALAKFWFYAKPGPGRLPQSVLFHRRFGA